MNLFRNCGNVRCAGDEMSLSVSLQMKVNFDSSMCDPHGVITRIFQYSVYLYQAFFII